MIQLVQNIGQDRLAAAPRSERVDILTVAKRMFNEGFKRSTILRITGLNEDEFVGMIRELHIGRANLA